MIEPHSQLEAPHKILLIEDDLNYAYLVELMLSDSQQLNCSIIHHKTLADGIGYLNQYGAREVAAVLLDHAGRLGGVELVGLGVLHVDQGDDVGGHAGGSLEAGEGRG